jgi:hypothetical protein
MRTAAVVFLFLAASSAGAAGPIAPPATVPEPRSITLAELPKPARWAHDLGFGSPHLEFRVDLDLIAPLGNGRGNAADYFRAFAKGGSRAAQAEAARSRRVEVDGDPVLPPNDPLLLEAELWIDQARLRFFPQLWTVQGLSTPVPNLIHMSLLARSWVARGKAQADHQAARRDFRRAIRLGRLLRQDDVTTLPDIAGLMFIRHGLNALYDDAVATSDATQAALLLLAIHDHEALRMESSRRRTLLRSVEKIAESPFGRLFGPSVDISDGQLEEIRNLTRPDVDRRFRIDALVALHIISRAGSSHEKEIAARTIAALRSDADHLVADAASWAAAAPLDVEKLRRRRN